ncbi:MAG: hypothetical protein AB6733_15740 [Clostridiaceae bacterium]
MDLLCSEKNARKFEAARPTELMQESAQLLFRIPIFLSHPSRLNPTQQEFVDAIIRQVRKALLFPRTLPVSEQYPETPLTNIRRMMLSSYGFIALNLKQRLVNVTENNLGEKQSLTVWEGSPFAQIEPAMAYQFGLPMLLIRETGVEQSGIWSFGIGPFLILEWNPAEPFEKFFTSNAWRAIFETWACQARNGFYLQTQPPFQYTCNKDDSR